MDPSRIHIMDTTLHLDPDIEAMITDLEYKMATRQTLNLFLRPDWMQGMSDFQYMLSQPVPPPVPSPWTVTPGKGPDTPRAGDLADISKAVYQIPAVQQVATRLHDEALRQVRVLKNDFTNASLFQQVGMLSMGGVVAGGIITPILANQKLRIAAFDFIKGKDIPVPGVDGLSFQILDKGGGIKAPIPFVPGLTGAASVNGRDVNVMFQLDVTALIRSR